MPQRTPAPRAVVIALATWILFGVAVLTIPARPLLAQGQQHGNVHSDTTHSDTTQTDTTATSSTGGGTMQPMCAQGCGGGGGGGAHAALLISPDGSTTPSRTGRTGGYTASFDAWNAGTASATYFFSCSDHGSVSCTSLNRTSANLAANAHVTVTATYSVGSAGTGVLAVVGGSETSGAQGDSGYVQVPVTTPVWEVTIIPSQTTTGTRMGGHGGYSDVFKVKNTGQNGGTVTFGCSSVTPVICHGVSLSSTTLAAGDSIDITVSDSIGAVSTTATGAVKLTATISTFSATGTTTVPAAHYEVAISPIDDTVETGAGVSDTASFLVRNLGAVSVWTTFPTCSATGVVACGTLPGGRTILAGDSAVVDLPFQATGEGTGSLSLSARENESYDTATAAVHAVTYAVAVTPGF
ncbi:MAG TPA: hypothetical protein VFL95_08735, partial [Gemmatimonadales bacterium]|nr:hypothetical protein [Gemmatimonadales bacterium]